LQGSGSNVGVALATRVVVVMSLVHAMFPIGSGYTVLQAGVVGVSQWAAGRCGRCSMAAVAVRGHRCRRCTSVAAAAAVVVIRARVDLQGHRLQQVSYR